MQLRNKVQLIGNLGNDPKVMELNNGNKLAKFSLATNETYKNKQGEKITETQWHNIVAWGKTADFIDKYIKKGNEIVVEGKLVNRNYKAEDGQTKYITEIQINELLKLNKEAR